jgi:hypothetical protein
MHINKAKNRRRRNANRIRDGLVARKLICINSDGTPFASVQGNSRRQP